MLIPAPDNFQGELCNRYKREPEVAGDTPATLTRVHFSAGEGPRTYHGRCIQSSVYVSQGWD